MTAEEMARIHASAMTLPAPWSATTFKGYLTQPTSIITVVENGFAIGRIVADEAELLTFAVAPKMQRQGVGRACLQQFLMACAGRGAQDVFLEVAESNEAARALYTSEGFVQSGLRKGYYSAPSGWKVVALILSKRILTLR